VVDVCLARVYDVVTTICAKSIYHLHWKVMNVPAHNILAADVFGTGILH